MNKQPLITNCLRPSLFGDIICSLPFLIYLEKKYPDSYKSVYIDKKCQQIVPFLLNHPLIDKIYVSELVDKVSPKDEEFFKGFDMVFEPFVPVYDEKWFNVINITESIFRINFLRGKGYINRHEWGCLTEEEKKPRLNQYFDVERRPKTIAIWPSVGYSDSDPSVAKRILNKQWWIRLIIDLDNMGYTVYQYGVPKGEHFIGFTKNRLSLSFFDAVKESLGADLTIGCTGGSQWALGAYGAKQIIMYCLYKENHITNQTAFLPTNSKNNLISIFSPNIIDITKEEVLQAVKLLNE